MSLGFQNNYTLLHFIEDDQGRLLYLGQGISEIAPDNEDETDDTGYYNSGGAKPEDIIGTKIGSTVTGHRYYGDAAQDYVASLETKIGAARVSRIVRIMPDGSKIDGPVTIKDIVPTGGEALAKGTFEFAYVYREMPSFTPPQTTNMPDSVAFQEDPITVAVGESLDLSSKIVVTPTDATPNCVFAVDDESLEDDLAMVDAAGNLIAKKPGTIRVTAKCVSKPAATCTTEITITGEAPSEKKSEVVASIKTEGSELGVNFADLGTFQIDGLKITGTAKQATAQAWNGEGQDKTGYFIGLHFDNCKKLYTAKHPEGKAPDHTGDWLILLGEESPTLAWFEVEDNSGQKDKYTVSVTAAAKVRSAKNPLIMKVENIATLN